MATTRETVKHLGQSILTRLENQGAIEMLPEARTAVFEEVSNVIGPDILTEQDLRERTLEKLGEAADQLSAGDDVVETERFRVAKKMVRETFGENELRGLYYQRSLKELADRIADYLMKSKHVDEVFSSDEELERAIVEIMKKFDPASLH